MAAAPVAIGIAGAAISAAGTAASIASQMSQGGGSAGQKAAQASIDQLTYLEQQQLKKQALSTEMIETAKQFANQQYDLDVQNLQQIRDLNQQQLIQQRQIAEQNFIDNQRSIEDQRLEAGINDANTDFSKSLQLQQANMSRDLGDLQRTGQYRLKETGRKISDVNTDLGVEAAKGQQDLERVSNEAQYGFAEKQADMSLMSEQQQLAQGREQALLEYMRGKDQLATDTQLLNISQEGVEQSAAYQRMSQDMQLYSDLTGIDMERRKGQVNASNDRRLAGQMSTSDYKANLAASGMEGLLKAQQMSTMNNYMMKGSLNNQLDINLAEIQTKRLGLQQTASQIETNLKLDANNRTQAAAQLQAARNLETLKNKYGMFIMPEAARQLQMMGVNQQAATNRMGSQLDRMGDQSALTQQALTDEYSRGVDQTMYNIDQKNTDLSRYSRDNDLRQAGIQNDTQRQQALIDLLYGNQALGKNYDMGVASAEAARQSTMQARDIDQLNQLAAQKAALSQAMSQIQPNLMGQGGRGGSLANIIGELGGLFQSGVGAYQQYWGNKNLQGGQNSYTPPSSYSGGNSALPSWSAPQSYNNGGYSGGNYSAGSGGYGYNGFVNPPMNIPSSAFTPNPGAKLGTGSPSGGF